MNIISLMALIGLALTIPYALYIDSVRRGRDSRGKYTKKSNYGKFAINKRQLFYSELRKGFV